MACTPGHWWSSRVDVNDHVIDLWGLHSARLHASWNRRTEVHHSTKSSLAFWTSPGYACAAAQDAAGVGEGALAIWTGASERERGASPAAQGWAERGHAPRRPHWRVHCLHCHHARMHVNAGARKPHGSFTIYKRGSYVYRTAVRSAG